MVPDIKVPGSFKMFIMGGYIIMSNIVEDAFPKKVA